MEINANLDHPLINPAFVIIGWGEKIPKVIINGKTLKEGTDYYVGLRRKIKGTDLIVFIKFNQKRKAIILLTDK